jgi:bacterioferritin (cytochrome b1)
MKKPNLIAGVVLIAIVISYFVYVAIEKNQKQKNIFLAKRNVEIESMVNTKKYEKVLRYKEREFKFGDLPIETQKKIVNEQLKAHMAINLSIKDFLVRFHAAAKKKNEYKNLDIKKIPAIGEVTKVLVPEEEVEKIYSENLSKFSKDHDVKFVKQQIRFELYSDKFYRFMQGNIIDIFKTVDAKLPAAPIIPDEWVETKGISPSYGNPDAPNHLIWIGHYGCPECSGFTEDLGLLIQKYGTKNIRVTFVPWNKNDIDSYAYLNTMALCVKDNLSEQKFWAYHSIAMNQSNTIKGMKNNDLQRARNFVKEVMKSNEFTEEQQKKAFDCIGELKESNETLQKYVASKRRLKFLPRITSPMVIFNGRLMDLEGRRVFHEVDKRLKELLK